MNFIFKLFLLTSIFSYITSVKKLGPCTAQLDDESIIDLSKFYTYYINYYLLILKFICL